MKETYEKYMKQTMITTNYEDIYDGDDNPLHIIDETRLVIDELSWPKFRSHKPPLNGYLKQGYIEMTKTLFSSIARFTTYLNKLELNNELKTIHNYVEHYVKELEPLYLGEENLKPIPYEVIGLYYKENIRSSRIFKKYDFQVPKDFLSNVLYIVTMIESAKLNRALELLSKNIKQNIMNLIEDREKIFRKIRKNLIRHIEDLSYLPFKRISIDYVVDKLRFEKELNNRCITILISIEQSKS